MAFTRQLYGNCATKKYVEESTGVLAYLMDPNKYYNCNPCRIDFGVVGGNNVSLYEGNMVDLESDMRGLTRPLTQCPAGYYLPGTIVQGHDNYRCKDGECLQDGRRERLHHLPTCKLIGYGPRQKGPGYVLEPKPQCGKAKRAVKPASLPRASKFAPVEWQGQQGVETRPYALY